MNYDLYPSLEAIDYHSYFKEQICYFYFHLSRKDADIPIIGLQNEFVQVLKIIKKTARVDDSYLVYLDLFYRMVGQTRDILKGKGEHLLSYMLLVGFYEVYPVLAIYVLHRFVQPITSLCVENPHGNESTPYHSCFGSWRDMKYLCEYIATTCDYGEDHPLIDEAISMMNNQLKRDFVHFTSGSKTIISFVAKWIPRENKKFHWIFNRLALDWCQRFMPYILSNAGAKDSDSYLCATSKYKSIYFSLKYSGENRVFRSK
jgi:hypothetical protein